MNRPLRNLPLMEKLKLSLNQVLVFSFSHLHSPTINSIHDANLSAKSKVSFRYPPFSPMKTAAMSSLTSRYIAKFLKVFYF